MGYLIFIMPALLLSIYAQYKVSNTFKKYSQVRSSRGVTGADVANTIARRSSLNIKIEQVAGSLSDHYDPQSKTVRLSETVYGSNSISALGVAAHEVGHALQHRDRYGLLELRHKLVPVTNFSSSASFPILLVGFFMQNLGLVMLGIILFSVVVLFHLVTLPVEINASRRAVALLSENGLVSGAELPGVKSVLSAAALTYLAATLSAVSNLLYYLLIFTGGGED
ncbi:MAG: zinc metallopeptidase [Syntrophomonadaceae bacterium]|jgi:Zn-dependent membrane protease YugP|nr:zinc metallopeptidase [Syntrophomonadaceae bacterium]